MSDASTVPLFRVIANAELIRAEMDRRGWSQVRQLADAAGLDHATAAKVLGGQVIAEETLVRVAGSLGLRLAAITASRWPLSTSIDVEAVRYELRRRGWRHLDLAKAARVDQATVSRALKRGRTSPRTAERFSAALAS